MLNVPTQERAIWFPAEEERGRGGRKRGEERERKGEERGRGGRGEAASCCQLVFSQLISGRKILNQKDTLFRVTKLTTSLEIQKTQS